MSFRDQYYDAVARFLVHEGVVQEDELDFVESVNGDLDKVRIKYYLKDKPKAVVFHYGRHLEDFLEELE